jgi:PHD/YefM family antitoxin component YafN of YafNO toxin-antitoxin module
MGVFFRYGPDAERREQINEIMGIEEGIAMAGEELMTVSEDERLRAWLMSAETYDLDRQSEMVYARREGRAKGRAEGYKEAKAEDQEQIQQAQEEIRRLEEEIRRLRGA